MDNILITYLIKVSVSLALFYGLYILFLKSDTLLKIRRIFFLFSIFFSFLFPLFTIEIPLDQEQEVQIPAYWLSQIEIGTQAGYSPATETPINIWSIVFIALSVVSLLFIIRLFIQLFSIVRLRINNESKKIDDFRIIKMSNKTTSPFSFFHWIFIDSEVSNDQKLAEILAHEQIHAKQLHSIDMILSEIVCICFWWNPFVWLLKREIKLNLEYLADEGVLKAGFDNKAYQYILLQTTCTNSNIPIINNFNVSQLKKRITMMNKKRSSIIVSVKYFLVIPVAIALILGNAVEASQSIIDNLSSEKVLDINQDGEPYTIVEQMPTYVGGTDAMYKYIGENLKYPVKAQEAGIQGRITIRFVIKKTGEVADITIIRGVDPSLDSEAIRIVKEMPKWNPGKQGGKEVDVYFTLPIVFRLSGSNIKVDTKSETEPNTSSDEVVVVGYGKVKEDKDAYISVTDFPMKKESTEKEPTFITVEQMPAYPGGESAMISFISDNLKYPVKAQEGGIQGRVTVRFIIKKDGEISDATIIRGIDPECDAEALRVVNLMPKWVPGKQNGKEADVYYTLPIVFKLNPKAKKEQVISPAKKDKSNM